MVITAMPKTIKPFKATHYSLTVDSDFSKLTCPPYDVITSENLRRLRKKSKYNFSHILLAEKNNYSVIKSLLISPDFSDDFVNDTELEYDLNLSLITASSLLKILEGFKNSKKHKQFPFKLLMRDVLIKEDRIVKAMSK